MLSLKQWWTLYGPTPMLGDRLTDNEVAMLLDSYQQGTTFRGLAEQFKISTTSVKKILNINKSVIEVINFESEDRYPLN